MDRNLGASQVATSSTDANAYGDLYVSPEDTAGAMNNDTVAARVVKRGHRGGQVRYAGVIVDIIERGREQFVGTLRKDRGLWLVQPEGKGFYRGHLIDINTFQFIYEYIIG